MRFLCLGLFAFIKASFCYGGELSDQPQISPLSSDSSLYNVTLMTWNILAPIWNDKAAIKAAGVIDTNLLEDGLRLKLIIQEILQLKPDILTLQEVQEDVFDVLKDALAARYDHADFLPHKDGYWQEYLPEGVEYVKNGLATFYNKKKFYLYSQHPFATGANGQNFALAAVLRPVLWRFVQGRKGRGDPIIVINCHLEAGATQAESASRYEMGTAIMDEAEKISDEISTTTKKPVVIIAGDINSQNPFPGFTNFKTNGYLDALEEIGDPAAQTFFFDPPVFVPAVGLNISGSTLDHVFIRSADEAAGRIGFKSIFIPDIASDDLKEASYIEKVTKIIAKELFNEGIRRSGPAVPYLLRSADFSTLFEVAHDEKEFNENVNRVLRLGSDHLPVLVRFGMDEVASPSAVRMR